MMNNELIRVAQTAVKHWAGTDTYHQAAEIISMLVNEIEHIEEAPTIKTSEWISVKDRLPDVDTENSRSLLCESITVTASNGKWVRPMIYERASVRGKMVNRWKWIWDTIYDGDEITHWMPLPKPPKEGAK